MTLIMFTNQIGICALSGSHSRGIDIGQSINRFFLYLRRTFLHDDIQTQRKQRVGEVANFPV
jgi:hypothetical protein